MTSHRRSQLQRSLAAGLAAAAIAAPAVQAAPIIEPGSGSGPQSAGADVPAVTTTIDEGFDWGSAAIGAGGAAAVLLVGAAGASALTPRRHRIGVTR